MPLVPRPGTHQLRYYGLFAPRAELRRLVIPPRATGVVQTAMFDRRSEPTPQARRKGLQEHQPDSSCESSSKSTSVPTSEGETTPPRTNVASPPSPLAKLEAMRWAEALRRMSDYDVESCPRCGARLAPVVVVLDPDEIRRTLELRAPGPIPVLSQLIIFLALLLAILRRGSSRSRLPAPHKAEHRPPPEPYGRRRFPPVPGSEAPECPKTPEAGVSAPTHTRSVQPRREGRTAPWMLV